MTSLLSLDLSEVTNLESIPDNQFKGSLLSDIKLPKGLKTIGKSAFANCSLLQIDQLPDGITAIGDNAFESSPRVTFTSLPSALESLGERAFNSCVGLINIKTPEALTSMGESVFEDCPLLETVDLSASKIAEIPNRAFCECGNPDDVLLPESAITIGRAAFFGTAVRDLSFINNVSSIGESAFMECSRLVAANIPQKITSVDAQVFANCKRLITASMPAGTKTVGIRIFNEDNNLSNISCAAVEAPEAENGAFDGVRARYISLTIPTISYRSYLNAPQWGKFQSIQNKIPVTIDEGVDVTAVAEDEYLGMLEEDALEEAAEEAAKEVSDEPVERIQRRISRRAEARKVTTDGKCFAALFNGGQIQTGTEGTGTRIFVNPKQGVKVTSILFNGKEMLSELEGNSLVLPAGGNGSLIIRTDYQGENPGKAPEAPEAKIGETTLSTQTSFESTEAVEVVLSCSTNGAKIYYLLTPVNSVEPEAETDYTLYSEPIKVEATSTLKIYAENDGLKSELRTYTIEIKPNFVAMTVADLDNVEVYSLQGMRVVRPQAGQIYIIRQGGRTYKAVVK